MIAVSVAACVLVVGLTVYLEILMIMVRSGTAVAAVAELAKDSYMDVVG
jgi:hypothetical protein